MDMRKSLLEAALKLFSKSGFHGSSVADIAKEAGVSKALFYHYFASKGDLLVLFVKERLEEWNPLVDGLEKLEDPQERLQFLVNFVLDELEKRSDWLRFLYMLYLSQEGVDAMKEAMKKYQGPFERLFRAERMLYEDLGCSNPEEEAVYVRSLLQGISLEYLLSGGSYPLQAMKAKILGRYLR